MARDPRGGTHPGLLLLHTLRLDREVDLDGLRSSWSCVSVDQLPALVQMERCGTWLLRRLREIGADQVIKPEFMTWLVEQSRAGAARNLLVDARAMELGRWLSGKGVPFVFIKGIARRLLAERHPYLDARVTSDVDVLLKAEDAEPVWKALQDEGYRFATDPELTPTGHYHLIPLVQRDAVSVELHTSTSRRVLPEEEWRRSTARALRIEREGLGHLVPSASEMLWQTVAHAETDGVSAYHLRYFQDAAVLMASAEIDWTIIEGRFGGSDLENPARMRGWFAAAAWLAGVTPPRAIGEGAIPFDLELAMRWRVAVLRMAGDRPRVIEKLVEQGTRTEAGLDIAESSSAPAGALLLRRRFAHASARRAYLAWRATAGRA